MLLILVLCVVISPAVLSSPSNVHTVLPESHRHHDRDHDDTKPVDPDEHRVRNYVSDHELPRDVPTRVKIVGDLGTPPPSVKLDFVPQQTYVQVRRYDAVKRLPQEAAVEESSTSEELANAPRLREVVTHKKTQEVYEEQGYEDAGYDHGGSKRLKLEEEVKDNHSVEIYGPKNGSTQNSEETKTHVATVSPSGRGNWSRHKMTTGKKTRYEDDGDKRKVITDNTSPIREKSSGNYTKFDGGKTIVVQNLTETGKKDSKNEGAESRRVASISKTKDNIEPTTYRPVMRYYDGPRFLTKQIKNESKRNRTRNRPRKRQESDLQKPQSDVIGSYDNSPWIPIPPPADYKRPIERERPRSESKKQVKPKINSEFHEPIHTAKYGYSVHHDTPYQYVFPTNIVTPELSNKPLRKSRPRPVKSDIITDGIPKGTSYASYEFIPQTNYDGSAINPKRTKLKKSSEENISFDNANSPSSIKHKEPITQFKTDFIQNSKQIESVTNPRQKNKPAHAGISEYFNGNLKSEPYREQKKKDNRHNIEKESDTYSDSRYTGSFAQDIGPSKTYDAPFITRLKKNNFNGDSRGEPSLRIYPKYELYPNFQNVKHPVKEENHQEQRPLSNFNKKHVNIESSASSLRGTKHENTRLSEYPKFNNNNNKPITVLKQPSESSNSRENYPNFRSQSPQVSEEKYSNNNKEEGYPKFETNKKLESTSSKSSPVYRLIPYEKPVKMNNPYSYVYHDDHYPSGSRYSGVKVEVTTQSTKFNDISVYWNNRHPHLPKDSIKNISDIHKAQDKSEDENARHVENLTLAHYSGHRKSGSNRPLPLEYNERVNNLAKLLNDNFPKRTRRDLEVIHIASSGTTTEIPVDTVVYPHYTKAPKESALRYATNPHLTPRKTAGGMEFYESTDKVQCTDDIAPSGNIVPERTEDGEWKGEPSENKPRVDALGDKIDCFKTKYFGSDPLDNPFFKEKDVGFPDVLFTIKKPLEKKKETIQPGKPHVDWNFAEELIPGNWFPDKDKRNRRSHNSSLPINHKVHGMDSIIPEPVIIDFPIKSSTIENINDTKLITEDTDSAVDEHVVRYSVQHPKHTTSKPEFNVLKDHSVDSAILGLIPPPKKNITNKIKKQNIFKKPTVKKILKKVKVDEELSESNLFDMFSPITSLFTNEDDVQAAPIVHNFFNIKMVPSAKFTTTTTIENNGNEKINKFQTQHFRRTKRNMKGIDLQKPKERKLNIFTDTNVTLSSPTARVRMYSPKNGTWFREKREHVSVNVDVRRKEPRYYYHTERPRIRVKRVVHNPPFYSRIGEVFSSKYLVSDQEKSETLPEEINVAFSTTPRYEYQTTPKFIPAIAYGDSKTKIIKYNDSVANSTNGIGTEHGNGANGMSAHGVGTNNFGTNNFGTHGMGMNNFGTHGVGTSNFGTNNFGTHGMGMNNFGTHEVGTNNFGKNNFGTHGMSMNNFGTHGVGTNNFGKNNFGTHGSSINNFGTHGVGTNNFGVNGMSTNGIGTNIFGTHEISTNNIGTNNIGTNNIGSNNIGTQGIDINNIGNSQLDKKESLIYVINPDTGHGKWMQVIKVKNEEDTKSTFPNGPVYLEKKGPVKNSQFKNSHVKDSHVKDSHNKETFGKFGFKGSTRDLFRNALGPTIDHRFKVKIPSTGPKKVETKAQSKKADCPKIIPPKKKEVRIRTKTTTEIPVMEEIDERPEEPSGEEENTEPTESPESVESPEPEPIEYSEPEPTESSEPENIESSEPTESPEPEHIEFPDPTDSPEPEHIESSEHTESPEPLEDGEGENEEEQPDVIEQPQYQQESEENPNNSENDDQEVHESKRKKPLATVKKPEFNAYQYGLRNKNKKIL
ncbi:Hypothetical protein CINCED_3A012127 [Cinara cedri]|uniref:Uncharacterized protein n=1 Tax=Cinara cedri TaxID=506608 RepID=A0A5E4M657_9HEMI|nr:Hypothetical protein CINCED_3A012127 [Cinara cedri]